MLRFIMPVKKNIHPQYQRSDVDRALSTLRASITRYMADIVALPDGDLILKVMQGSSSPSFDLSTQEINSLLSYEDLREQTLFLAHRIRFTHFPRNKVVSTIPPYLLIEPTSICNMRCPMCFQSDKSFTTNQYMGTMPIDMYMRLIDEAYSLGIGAITLASRGEPTLHPQFIDMLRYTAGKFYEFKINTNASRLTDEIIHQLFKSEVSLVVFSIDSHDPAEYEMIRKGGKFDQVLNNISRFAQISSEYPHSKLSSRISGVRFFETQNPEAFQEFWSPFVDDVILNPAEERWDTYNNPIDYQCGMCAYPFERLYVWHDGTYNPCDVDYKSNLSPGSFASGLSIAEAWSSLKLKQLRDDHILPGSRHKQYPCDRCGVCHDSM